MKLLDTQELSKLLRDYQLGMVNKTYILKLWQTGLLKADLVLISKKIKRKGLKFLAMEGNFYAYLDKRATVLRPEGYGSIFAELKEPLIEIMPLFHPFRSYVLYKLFRSLNPNASPIQTLLYTKGYDWLIQQHIKRFNNWSAKPETIALIDEWNTHSLFSAISEPIAHVDIFNRVTWNGFSDSYSSIIRKLKSLEIRTRKLYRSIGQEDIEKIRRELGITAETIDPNGNLHLVIRLMNVSERERIKGKIGLSMLFLTMAETLRRVLELEFNEEYPEEDEIGIGSIIKETKILLQGSTRILDNKRSEANQFLRRLGLDYGVRARVYVEGLTEYSAIAHQFSHNSSVEIIDLKGNFVARYGRGVSFRESLRNDLKSKIFSIILLDGNVSDNCRAVKQAATNDEICGAFFISNPDFELMNFTHMELSKIISDMAYELGHHFDKNLIYDNIKNADSAKKIFNKLRKLSSRLIGLSKGEDWGIKLAEYSTSNKKGSKFDDNKDRQLNQAIRYISQAVRSNYVYTRKNSKVDPKTGLTIKR